MPFSRLTVDLDSTVPVYRQIAEGVIAAFREGQLSAGHRLPPTRDLSRQLGVNRNTVVAAYDSLAAAGWVQSHTGRGTFLTVPGGGGEGPPVGDSGQGTWFTAFSRAADGASAAALQ